MEMFITINVLILVVCIVLACWGWASLVKGRKMLQAKQQEKEKVYAELQKLLFSYDSNAVEKRKKQLYEFVLEFYNTTTDYNKERIDYEIQYLYNQLVSELKSLKSSVSFLRECISDLQFNKLGNLK